MTVDTKLFEDQIQILHYKMDMQIFSQAMPIMYNLEINDYSNQYEKDYMLTPVLKIHNFIESVSSKPLCMILGFGSLEDRPKEWVHSSWNSRESVSTTQRK